MTYGLTIAAVAKELLHNTLRIHETTNGRNTASFQVLSLDGTYRPALNAEVIITLAVGITSSSVANPTVITTAEAHGLVSGQIVTIASHSGSTPAISGNYTVTVTGASTFTIPVNVTVGGTGGTATHRIFGGHISRPTESGFGGVGGTAIVTFVTCVDFNALADRNVVTETIVAGTLKAALQALDDYLTDYSVTLDSAQVTGDALPELEFENTKVANALSRLSALTNFAYVWEIDYDKTLRMFSLGSKAAPFNVVTGDGNAIGDITVEPSRTDYANYIVLLAGEGTREVTEALTFDGIVNSFVLDYTLYSHRGYVTNGAANETLSGPGEGGTWEFTPATNTLTRAAGVPAAGSGSITFTAQFPVEVTADGGAAAADRVKKVVTYADVFDVVVAQALANAELVRAELTTKTIRYRTHQVAEIHPGQTQTITVTARNVSGTCLVQSVDISNPTGNLIVRDVTAIEGTVLPEDWRETARSWGGSSSGGATAGAVGIVTAGGIGGTGTAGTLPKWATATTLGNSLISESGSVATVGGALTSSGVLTVNGFGTHAFTATGTGATSIRIQNSTAGTGNSAYFGLANDSGAEVGVFQAFSSTYTTSGPNVASGARLASVGVGGLSIGAEHASGVLRQYWGGTTLKLEGTGDQFLPGTNWSLDFGSATRMIRTLFAAELQINTLVAQDVISTIGGEITVAPTTSLQADLASAATSISVEHNEIAVGDRLLLKARGQVEYLAVTAGPTGTGPYSYTVTRNLDASGANNWLAGDAVQNTGTTGDGLIELHARAGLIAGVGPTIVGQVRGSATWNDLVPRWAVGNLNGYYGYATDEYGAAFGVPTAAWIKIDPTNGIRIGHNATTKISLTAAGDASFSGSITATSGTIGGWDITAATLQNGTNVSISTSFAFGGGNKPGIVVSDGGTNYSALIGGTASSDIGLMVGGSTPSSAPFRVTLAGALTATSATITGTITSTAGTIGGWTIGATSLTGGNATLASSGNLTLGTVNDVVRLSADDATYRLWIGNATAASAAFSVTKAGALVATSATITGAITATSGSLSGLTVGGTLTISGGSIVVGSDLTIDGSGLTLTSGTTSARRYKFSDGSYLQSQAGVMIVSAVGELDLDSGTSSDVRIGSSRNVLIVGGGIGTLTFDSTGFYPSTTTSFGKSAATWGDAYFALGTDTGTSVSLTAANRLVKESSSERYKESIAPLSFANPLAILEARPIRFDYIGGTKGVIGFSAEQLAGVAPELVNCDRDGRPDSIRQQALLAFILVAMREQQNEIAALKSRPWN